MIRELDSSDELEEALAAIAARLGELGDAKERLRIATERRASAQRTGRDRHAENALPRSEKDVDAAKERLRANRAVFDASGAAGRGLVGAVRRLPADNHGHIAAARHTLALPPHRRTRAPVPWSVGEAARLGITPRLLVGSVVARALLAAGDRGPAGVEPSNSGTGDQLYAKRQPCRFR